MTRLVMLGSFTYAPSKTLETWASADDRKAQLNRQRTRGDMNLLMGVRLLVDFELHCSYLTLGSIRHTNNDVFEINHVASGYPIEQLLHFCRESVAI